MSATGVELDVRRAYFNAVLGGLGGLLGWATGLVLTGAVLGGAAPGRGWQLYVQQGVLGLSVGVLIGAAVGAADGLVASRSRDRLLRGVRYGAGVGAAGGVVGLLVGEIFYGFVGGGVWPRAMGWAIFGGMIGCADGFAAKMPVRLRYGLIGGLLGGLVGGSTYTSLLVVLTRLSGDRAFGQAVGGATGLVLLGACIGALIGLVESILRVSWVTVIGGPHEGETRTLDPVRSRTTIGRIGRCDLVLARDPTVGDIHATICREGDRLVLAPEGGAVYLGGPDQGRPVDRHALSDGDVIRLGTTRLRFTLRGGRP